MSSQLQWEKQLEAGAQEECHISIFPMRQETESLITWESSETLWFLLLESGQLAL